MPDNQNKLKREHVAEQSPDLREDLRARLRDLVPEAFAEGKLDAGKLKALLGENGDAGAERYSFSWAGKRDAIAMLQVPTRATVIPDRDNSVDFDEAQHVFIEGENLEVLKVLYRSYFGRVKMIYIDPPYNTGNDFIYPDDFSDPLDNYLRITGQKNGNGDYTTSQVDKNGRIHSAWISMMYPRLSFARQLLRDDGLIFISCDDNENKNLRSLMDEIFGEENFIAQFVWNTEGHTDNQFDVKVTHEYIVAYARRAGRNSLAAVVDPNTREASNLWKGFAENSITKNGIANPPSEVTLPVGFPCVVKKIDLPSSRVSKEFFSLIRQQGYISRDATERFNASYPIRLDRMEVVAGKLQEKCRVYSGWANVNKLKAFIENACKPLDEEGDKISFYLSEKGVIYYRRDRQSARNIVSVLRNMGTTEKMRAELEKQGIFFQYPKPKELLQYLIKAGCDEDGILLDFFAGSGTLAQACLTQNKLDGLKRSFILVQLPEPTRKKDADGNWVESLASRHGFKTIAEIARARLKGLVTEHGREELEFGERIGFRAFLLASSNIRSWTGVADKDADALAGQIEAFSDSLVPGWKPENVIWEVALREGYSLTSRIEKISNTGKQTFWCVTDPEREQSFVICLDDTLTLDAVRALKLGKDALYRRHRSTSASAPKSHCARTICSGRNSRRCGRRSSTRRNMR